MAISDRKSHEIREEDRVTEPTGGKVGRVTKLGRELVTVEFNDGKIRKYKGRDLQIVLFLDGKWTSRWDEVPDEGHRLRWESDKFAGWRGLGAGRVALFSISYLSQVPGRHRLETVLPGYTHKSWDGTQEELKDKADELMLAWGRKFFPEMKEIGE